VRLTIEGNGFLWNMVRIIAGTLLEVGLGRRPAADSARALRTLQRTDAGPTAPAHGLCLERVWYEGECAGETEA
jgi:tRNA pseudouridine38-40 synthase